MLNPNKDVSLVLTAIRVGKIITSESTTPTHGGQYTLKQYRRFGISGRTTCWLHAATKWKSPFTSTCSHVVVHKFRMSLKTLPRQGNKPMSSSQTASWYCCYIHLLNVHNYGVFVCELSLFQMQFELRWWCFRIARAARSQHGDGNAKLLYIALLGVESMLRFHQNINLQLHFLHTLIKHIFDFSSIIRLH